MEENRLIIYHTVSGRTGKVASAISKGLKATMKKVENFNLEEFEKADLIGLGSGIYYGRHHKKLIKLVKELPEGDKKMIVFSTSGCGTTKFHKKLCNLLRNKGYTVVDEMAVMGFDICGLFKLVGGINRGKPDEEDLREAEEFGRRVRKGKYLKK